MPLATTLTSSSYTHKFLCSLAEAGLPSLRKQWNESKKVKPLILSWPSQPIKRQDGSFTEKVCMMELPEDSGEWPAILRELIGLTSSCGLLLVEQQAKRVRSLLETPKGTRCWDLPIEDRGDAVRLGQPVISNNKESIGMLWRSQQSRS